MIILDHDQGSPEWQEARLGIPTASQFARLVTPTGKPSSQLDGYVNELIAEILMHKRVEDVQTPLMARGSELEADARAWYSFHTDQQVAEVGFVLREDRQVGCSPDGLIHCDDLLYTGGLEIKCPKADKHIGYLRGGKLPGEYIPQVQGCLWLCECDTWDFVSYHPELPEFVITVGRDEDFIRKLQSQIRCLIDRKMEALNELLPKAA